MKLGVIGVGHLSTAILKGLVRAAFIPAGDIVLSPRGHSNDLSKQFGFDVAESNANLVEDCDTILLAVRPKDAVSAVNGLPWRSDHVLMTACAGVSTSELLPVLAGAKVVRIMPTIASEFGESATLVFPEMPQLQPFFSALGKSYVLDDEDQFEVGTVSAAIFGWAQALIMNSNDWAAKNGMNADQARQLLAQTFISAGTIIAEKDQPVAEILKSLATPGGITEAGLQHLENTQTIRAWEEASEIVLKKLGKTA